MYVYSKVKVESTAITDVDFMMQSQQGEDNYIYVYDQVRALHLQRC